MTAENIILLALCLALYAMLVVVALADHREGQGGGIRHTQLKSTPATPKAPPPPKKREKGDDRK